jgi:2-keto-4-pentenoate hydratase/2-oxohepta-3-ene-1,7-dioic acid hydratase in catechol pathway
MKFCRIEVGDGPSWGQVVGDEVRLLSGSPIDGGHAGTGASVPLAKAVFLPPVIPGVFYAVGLNYRGHVRHAQAMGHQPARLPDRPEVGYRANNALTGHGQPIIKPADVQGRFEAEGEVVAVIGRRLRNATYEEAKAAIFGWTIGNDVSARAWQHEDRSFWRSKNADTFKPMGPWIETEVDPLEQTTAMRVNGEVKQCFRTGDMIFDPYRYIVSATKYITMHPGDVLWMGADGTCQLEPGDTVSVEITGIGVLSNPVHAEAP